MLFIFGLGALLGLRIRNLWAGSTKSGLVTMNSCRTEEAAIRVSLQAGCFLALKVDEAFIEVKIINLGLLSNSRKCPACLWA